VSSPPLVNGFGDFNYLVLTGQGEYLTFTLFAANPTLNLSLSDFLVPSTGVHLSGGNPFVAGRLALWSSWPKRACAPDAEPVARQRE
jgi:hypothetical protein